MLLATALLFGACVDIPAEPPQVGDAAPDFTLLSHEGDSVSLGDFRGRWLVLYFYPADFTRSGTEQAQGFQRDSALYGSANAAVVGVSSDDVFSHRAFAADVDLSFPLLSDRGTHVSRQYGSTMPFGMIKTLAARNTFIVGPDGAIAAVLMDVEPEGHSRDVLRMLRSLKR